MRLTKKILIGMGLVTAVVALTLLSGSPVLAAPPDKDVTVVNTPANPVPVIGTVTTTGTSTVSGTVNAAQSGPWTVGIDPDQQPRLARTGCIVLLQHRLLDHRRQHHYRPRSLRSQRREQAAHHRTRFQQQRWCDQFQSARLGTLPELAAVLASLSEFSLDEATTSLVYELPPPSVIVRLTNGAGGGANYHVVLIGR